MAIDELIYEAIMEGARAGVYRRAARLNPKTAGTWQSFAELHSERAVALLCDAMTRLDAGGAGPCPFCAD
jgi:hypothetical protein